MNLKTPYEQLIGEKLEQDFPVPDMADAIWARIELELDAAPAQDADVSPDATTMPAKAVMSKWLAIAIGGILTVVLLFILLKKSFKKKERTKEPAPTQQTINKADEKRPPDSTQNPVNFNPPISPVVRDTAGNVFAPAIFRNDSLLSLPPAINYPDSTLTSILPPKRLPADSSLLTPPPGRKPRGVQIDNSDYKIQQEKKDSMRRGN